MPDFSKAHPLVRYLISLAGQRPESLSEICRRAGLDYSTVAHWASFCNPSVQNLEALGNALGVTLLWMPLDIFVTDDQKPQQPKEMH